MTSCLETLPNVKVVREILLNKGTKYLPNERDFSAKFGIQVLTGKKFLLDLSKVKYIHGVSRYNELSAKRIWYELKKDPNIRKYFPDMTGTRVP